MIAAQQQQVQEPQMEGGAAEEAPSAGATSEPTNSTAPLPSSVPRKTWALPKAPPKIDDKDDNTKAKKKSLLEIIEEEKRKEQEASLSEQKKLEQRLIAEEEAAFLFALQASTAVATIAQPGLHTMDEDLKLALMLSMQDQPSQIASMTSGVASIPPAAAAAAFVEEGPGLTEEEMMEIEKALLAADAAENAKTDQVSLKLALELQGEEDGKIRATQKRSANQGNVRTISRHEFLREQQGNDPDGPYQHVHDDYDYDDDLEENGAKEAGFRINSTKQSPWSRADGASIRGPNDELRTKHDPKLQAQANAYRLELRADDETGERAHVGNKAFNAFHRSMQKKTVKGVAAHGHGRATADADKTREGALDGRVRLQIARAVNNGLIETFHGCVKEGKEAMVFYAEQGTMSEGFDVAVKVFKRMSEFRNRGDYVAFDPRYGDGGDFRHSGPRQQLEQWAEKEHRNLVRAYRSKVPVPKPLLQKDNVLFMRFLGDEGWPAPQLRELDIKKGSKKWTALYEQTMKAMQLLYCNARLVHGDLSEYNIMVCPKRFLKRVEGEAEICIGDEDEKLPQQKNAKPEGDQNMACEEESEDLKPAAVTNTQQAQSTAEATKPQSREGNKPQAATPEANDDSLHIALIDFGQAVDWRHPGSEEMLTRDVTRVKEFFDRMGITTIAVEAAMAYVQTKDAALR